jgi:hypothetical protein
MYCLNLTNNQKIFKFKGVTLKFHNITTNNKCK